MKKYINGYLITAFISGAIFMIICLNNEYMKYNMEKCMVIDKVTTISGKYTSTDFWLILKDDKKRVFDLIVSPATFSQADIGEEIVFSLREFDIRQTLKNNIIFLFGSVISFVILLVTAIFGFVFLVSDWYKQKEIIKHRME